MSLKPRRVADLFLRRRATLAVAESCTGGLIMHALTGVPGSSRYLRGGVVAYANDLKRTLLGVSAATLRRQGAVSQETALEMAAGIKRRARSTVGLAVTGIAGPGGGTPTKPVGTVFLACAAGRHIYFKKFAFPGNRAAVKEKTKEAALAFLLACLT
ncbi:MAG: CinA family protein [Deltaproteobacteria bacterium]